MVLDSSSFIGNLSRISLQNRLGGLSRDDTSSSGESKMVKPPHQYASVTILHKWTWKIAALGVLSAAAPQIALARSKGAWTRLLPHPSRKLSPNLESSLLGKYRSKYTIECSSKVT
jgi:hypothetical protein